MKKMFAPERRKMILEKLHESQRVTIKELSKEIKVSEATLRTDLTILEEDGLLKRTHGGAILNHTNDTDISFSTREQKNRDEKISIAKKAVTLISEGQCIMLDASSTALELARLLKDTSIRLTVVTSGINTALELNNHPDITVILIGGIVKRGSNSIEGNLGASILTQIHIDIMFTSANGFSIESGLTDFSVYEVELKKSMIQAATKTIALLDSSKLNKNSIASFANVREINLIISDNIPETMLEKLATNNVEVIIADPS